MKKDIPTPEVKHVTVVIKPEQPDQHWSVHLVNGNEKQIKNVLVASRGYSEKKQVTQETSVLRHFLEDIAAKSSKQIELIDTEVFHLFNEFDVTYYLDDELHFKKFVFVPESIHVGNLSYNDIMATDVVVHS
ncbi:MAG: hypothetical protein ABFS32_07875 [Bacteroidota bacterium]